MDFFLSDDGRPLEVDLREDLNGQDASEVSPQLAVWSPDRSSQVVSEMIRSHRAGTICKYYVILGEAFFNKGRRRYREDRTGTKFKVNYWTVLR